MGRIPCLSLFTVLFIFELAGRLVYICIGQDRGPLQHKTIREHPSSAPVMDGDSPTKTIALPRPAAHGQDVQCKLRAQLVNALRLGSQLQSSSIGGHQWPTWIDPLQSARSGCCQQQLCAKVFFAGSAWNCFRGSFGCRLGGQQHLQRPDVSKEKCIRGLYCGSCFVITGRRGPLLKPIDNLQGEDTE